MDLPFSFTGVILVIFTFCVLGWWTKRFNRKKHPPGPWGPPLLGHLLLLGDNLELKYSQWRKKYGDIFCIRLGCWNTVIVNGYDAIKDAAERKDDVFSGRPDFVSQVVLKETFDGMDSLSFCNFSPKYLQLRKLTTMAIRQYMNKSEYTPKELFYDEADKLAEKLLRYPSDEPVSIFSDIHLFVISVLYQMLYGIGKEDEIKPHLNVIIEASEAFAEVISTATVIDVIPWLRYVMKSKVDQLKKSIAGTYWITKSKISEHLVSFQKGQTRDILDALCELSENLPDKDNENDISATLVQFQSFVLQAAGFDTTSTTLLFIILYLIKYPDVQERVQKEIDNELGNNRNIYGKDQSDFPYLMATILEVMRKTTIVPFALPHYTLRDTKLRGYDIDKDTVVFFNLHSVAYDEEYWGDPENFRPERFLDDGGKLDKAKCCHLLNFSAGRRQCPGENLAKMNIFIVVLTLLQRCSFRKEDDCELDLEPIQGIALSPKPFKVIIQRRF